MDSLETYVFRQQYNCFADSAICGVLILRLQVGNPGKEGEDGYDVQLESEPELPCVVCPAGPPGPR